MWEVLCEEVGKVRKVNFTECAKSNGSGSIRTDPDARKRDCLKERAGLVNEGRLLEGN